MARILVDGRFVGVGDSVGRQTLETLKGILVIDKENDYTLLIRPQGKKLLTDSYKLEAKNLHLKILDIPHYSMAEQTTLLKYLNHEKFDLVHFMQFNHPIRYKGKFIVNILDLTLFGHLYRKSRIKGLAFNMVMKSAIKNSARIITISETSKKEIVEIYGVDPDKIEVIYLGIDASYNLKIVNCRLKIEDTEAKYGITSRYLLYTGMWKRHKNILRMLEAFVKVKSEIRSSTSSDRPELESNGRNPKSEITASSGIPSNCGTNNKLKIPSARTESHLAGVNAHLRGEGQNQTPKTYNLPVSAEGVAEVGEPIQLVLAGKIDKNEPEVLAEIDRINSFVISDSDPESSNSTFNFQLSTFNSPIKAVGFVAEEDLPYLYAGALAYVHPSLSEGFGLPPLEAMACGTSVISSNASAMPEILGDAPLYFDPYSVEDIKRAMMRVITDEKLRDELSKKGRVQAGKYTWQKTAEKTLDIYNRVSK